MHAASSARGKAAIVALAAERAAPPAAPAASGAAGGDASAAEFDGERLRLATTAGVGLAGALWVGADVLPGATAVSFGAERADASKREPSAPPALSADARAAYEKVFHDLDADGGLSFAELLNLLADDASMSSVALAEGRELSGGGEVSPCDKRQGLLVG